MLITGDIGEVEVFALRCKASRVIDFTTADRDQQFVERLRHGLREHKRHLGEFEVVQLRLHVKVME